MHLIVVFAAAILLMGSQAFAADVLPRKIDDHLRKVRQELIDIRHDLHRHPEISGEEKRTAGVITRHLAGLGLEVRTNVGGHGVVALLKGKKPGPVVAYRADMDAVRSDAEDPAEYRSVIKGVRHICGHDVHVTVALGIAEALAAVREDLPGSVKFIFQPAEENVQGAKAMIAGGALTNPKPAAIFAFHTSPFPVGVIGFVRGLALPGFASATLHVEGDEASPIARKLADEIRALSTLPAETLRGDPAKSVLTNFINPTVWVAAEKVVGVQLRASNEENYASAKANILKLAKQMEKPGLKVRVEYVDRQLPDTINDTALVDGAMKSVARVAGEQAVAPVDGASPFFGEDFSYFQKEIPGAILWLGVSNPEKNMLGVPHSPTSQADDAAIEFGARAMAIVLLDYLGSAERR